MVQRTGGKRDVHIVRRNGVSGQRQIAGQELTTRARGDGRFETVFWNE
ncbi:MAG: hypothetical protein ACOCR6_00280 [archaeon]